MHYDVFNADCLELLKDHNPYFNFSAVITDPPYELGFMGKDWDRTGVAFKPETWNIILEQMLPGAHLIAFGAPKTYHRLASAIEDAGFEIRDSLMWLFGTGFPKGLNVSLAIDKAKGAENRGHRISVASRMHPDGTYEPNGEQLPAYEPKSDEASRWLDWHTGLKPAYEPIVLARAPMCGTVAETVLSTGTSALNIGATRINDGPKPNVVHSEHGQGGSVYGTGIHGSALVGQTELGRWPANVMLDEEAARQLDLSNESEKPSRYFYSGKASQAERSAALEAKNRHPTVKPIALMRHLIRLITPPGGMILDPFLGSGTTGIAAQLEGFDFIGIEKDPAYAELARKRIEAWRIHLTDDLKTEPKTPGQLDIFGELK